MKHEIHPVFVYVNNLFKTTEYRLDDDNITIKELSLSDCNTSSISLDTIDVKTSTVNQSFITSLYFISGLLITLCFFSFRYENYSLSSVASLSLLIFIPMTLYFHFKKPEQHKTYVNTYTGKSLFSFRNNYKDRHLKEFINILDQRIIKSKCSYEINKNDIDHSAKQRSINMVHLDSLFNSGMVDEITYKRINNNINQYELGNTDLRPLADVIYLPLAR